MRKPVLFAAAAALRILGAVALATLLIEPIYAQVGLPLGPISGGGGGGASTTTPGALGFATPSPDPGPPPGTDIFTPPVVGNSTGVVTDWNKVGDPGNALVIGGKSITQVEFYGQTTNANGATAVASPLATDTLAATFALPSSLPGGTQAPSMYLAWPYTGSSYNLPVAVNRADGWWVGPNPTTFIPGDVATIYGQNLAIDGSTVSYVYFKPTGSFTGQWLSPRNVTPYSEDVTIPSGTATGTYELWVHNGHGGDFGWSTSGAIPITIVSQSPWHGQSTAVLASTVTCTCNGIADDSSAINTAFNGASAGSNVVLPAGTAYLNSASICPQLPAGVTLSGQGPASTTIEVGPLSVCITNGMGVINASCCGVEADSNGLAQLTVSNNGQNAYLLDAGTENNFRAYNVNWNCKGEVDKCWKVAAGGNNFQAFNGTFIGSTVSITGWSHNLLSGIAFELTDGAQEAGAAVQLTTADYTAIVGSTFADYVPGSPLTTNTGNGRAFGLHGYDDTKYVYIGGNTISALGPVQWSQPTSAQTTSGPVLHFTNTASMSVGDPVGSTNIPGNTTILSIVANTSVTLSANVSGTVTNDQAIDGGAQANQGEQVLVEPYTVLFEGNAVSATSASVTVGSNFPTSNGFGVMTHPSVEIVAGTGVGQTRNVSSFSGATANVTPNWTVVPDTTSVIGFGPTVNHLVVYHNTDSGKITAPGTGYGTTVNSANVGISYNGVAYDNIYANNALSDMWSGLVAYNVTAGSGVYPSAFFFNETLGNTLSTAYYGEQVSTNFLQSSYPTTNIGHLGNLWRGNTYTTLVDFALDWQTDYQSFTGGNGDQLLFDHDAASNLPLAFGFDQISWNTPSQTNNQTFSNVVLWNFGFTLGTGTFSGSQVFKTGAGSTSANYSFTCGGNTFSGFQSYNPPC